MLRLFRPKHKDVKIFENHSHPVMLKIWTPSKNLFFQRLSTEFDHNFCKGMLISVSGILTALVNVCFSLAYFCRIYVGCL